MFGTTSPPAGPPSAAAHIQRPGDQQTILGVGTANADGKFDGIWSALFMCHKGPACEVCFPPKPVIVIYHFVDHGDNSEDREVEVDAHDVSILQANAASAGPKKYVPCGDVKCTNCTPEANVRKWEENSWKLQSTPGWVAGIERDRNRRALSSTKGSMRGWRFGGQVEIG
ncbi:hypothetical protein LTR36_002686 [Oleoguttula mirabilis]|uniref:Uncharacterized protein n=1 Tax=Oleoguttula mirabilis TaxID=1507867 RepID=A0AAV9JKK2_9PEZI|nr:hypothetical protein LTR36_002686 [Oleoguttula mirabilis]